MHCELKKKKEKTVYNFLQIASWKQFVARKTRVLDKISGSHLNHAESNLVYFSVFGEKQLGAALEKVHLLGVFGVLDREGLAAHDLWGSESIWGCISNTWAARRFPPSQELIPFPTFGHLKASPATQTPARTRL